MPVMVADALVVDDEARAGLEVMARSSSLPHRQVTQARALLLAADGAANAEIARRCGTTTLTVRRWRARFAEQGLAGVGLIAPGRGRKPTVRVDLAAAVVEATLGEAPPGDEPQWSTRLMAERFGIGKDTVARIWRARGIRPHRVSAFKVSTDPAFEERLTDVVGLYLDPPERAVVFCVDEKTQVQALDRTQPSLPLVPGRAATMTHDYKRNGTTNLYAALDVATGRVLTLCQPRHRHRGFLAFLKMVNANVPRGCDVHVIVDNSSTHTHPNVRAWLARHRRVRLHFTPTAVVAQPRRAVVPSDHQPAAPPSSVPLRRPAHRRHRRLDRPLERHRRPLRLDQDRRRDPRQDPTRPNRPHPHHQIRDAPLASHSGRPVPRPAGPPPAHRLGGRG